MKQASEHSVHLRHLQCLYDISGLVEKTPAEPTALLRKMVEIIPFAWQYPEVCGARIAVEGREFLSVGYTESVCKLGSDIIVNGGVLGCVEVCYKEQRPPSDEGPFLNEERALLDAIAGRIGRAIERSRVEEALQQSEQRFRHTFDHAAFGIALVSPDGRFLQVNRSLCSMLGYSEQEMLAMTCEDVTHPDDVEVGRNFFRHLLEGRGYYGWLEKRYIRRDGRIVWTLLSQSAILDSEGHPVYLISQIEDATERKRTEEALAVSEERYRIIAHFNYDWELWIDSQQRLLYVSPSSERVTGFTAEEFLDDPSLLTKVVHPADRTFFKEHLLQTTSHDEERIHSFDFRIVRKDGTERWINHVCRPVVTAAGKPWGRRISHRDVTDRKRAEDELRESEERFRAIFEHARDSIFIKDRSLKYIEANSAMVQLLGLQESEIIGHEASELFGSEAAREMREADMRVLSGHPVEKIHTRTVMGVPMTFHDVAVPLRDAAGDVIGICGVSRNVTELTKATMPAPTVAPNYPSKTMKITLRKARMAAASEAIILLLGESGSGKDYLARWIHEHSYRARGPYFVLNCAALPHDLAESELFGHEAGAFTGARTKKKGLVELAEGGTLLLNEIGELSLALQAKLLTFLDSRSFVRVGGLRNVHVDVRLIAATHRDLDKEIEEGRFSEALFYRLNVFPIKVPPLRERPEDIPILVEEILTRLSTEMHAEKIPRFDPKTFVSLGKYHWPGNVRELRNVVERALIIAGLDCSTLPFPSIGNETDEGKYVADFDSNRTLAEIREDLTKAVCIEGLRRCRGNKTQAARLLGISRDSLYRYIENFRLEDTVVY